MKPMIWICWVLVLWPLHCFGQFGGVQQPIFGETQLPSSETLASVGLAYRWVATDLPTNVTVTNWEDRVQGHILSHGNDANRPTNAATGVWFDATHWLTNIPLTPVSSNLSIGLILNISDLTAGIHPGIVMNNRSGVDDAKNFGYLFNYNTSLPLAVESGGSFGDFTIAPYPVVNVTHDIVFNQAVMSGQSFQVCYTNNVLTITNIIGTSSCWGGDGLSPAPNMPAELGHNSTRNSGPSMRIKEYWVWTNAPGTFMNISVRSNFHSYGTSTYGY